jgi:multidrug resistance efflux pump
MNLKPHDIRFITPKELKKSRAFFELSLPKAFYWFLYGVLALLVAAIIWAWLGSMEIIVKAPAVLRSDRSTSEIVSETTGLLMEKNFTHGERVAQGQLLWALDRTDLDVAISSARSEELRLQRDLENLRAVDALLEGRVYLTTSQEALRQVRLIELEQRRLSLLTAQARREWEQEAALPSNARTAQRLSELEEAYLLAQAHEERYTLEQKQFLNDELLNLDRQLEDLARNQAQLDRQMRATEVRAPLEGVVDEITRLNLGDLLPAGTVILRIFPLDPGELRADILVASNDIAQLEPDMEFRLTFPGYSPSEYGYLRGKVLNVPQDAWRIPGEAPVFPVEALWSKTGWAMHKANESNYSLVCRPKQGS